MTTGEKQIQILQDIIPQSTENTGLQMPDLWVGVHETWASSLTGLCKSNLHAAVLARTITSAAESSFVLLFCICWAPGLTFGAKLELISVWKLPVHA